MQPQRYLNRRTLLSLAALACGLGLGLTGSLSAADLVPVEPLGLRVARGFRLTLWADADLANDIRAMTIDSQGRVVVSGPGYIRTLLDTDGSGAAETAVEFAPMTAGAQGLCFDGPNLFCVGDSALRVYTDLDGDGQADGPPQVLMPIETAGHGAGSIRKGPDGWLYLVAGNEANFGREQVSLPASPIQNIEGGAMLRLRPDGRGSECIAQGFRSPQDFDFNWLGDLFTFDSDAQGDLFLPWYLPARLYHVGYAGHHGWRLRGQRESWPRPPYSPDTVSLLAPVGHAIPSGVVCYRHYQFPLAFRNGLFACDWSSGRVYFSPLLPNGATYRANPDVFLESIGSFGFAPIDLAVAPDGALLVAAGGSRTRGSIYRIEYPPGQQEVAANNWLNLVTLDLQPVLSAPEPLAAWSRAEWLPVARKVGPEPFAQAVADNRQTPSARVRSIEILTELFGGLSPAAALAGANSPVSFVRARVAWSLGRAPVPNGAALLLRLAGDADPQVRRFALDALGDHAAGLDLAILQRAIDANLGSPEKRVRQGAARLARLLPEPAWRELWARQAEASPLARLTATMAFLWRSPDNALNTEAVEAALTALANSKDKQTRLEALRLVTLGLGGYRLENPTLEAYAAYEPAVDLQAHQALVQRIRNSARVVFPDPDPEVTWEAARLLAMVQDDSPVTSTKVLRLITAQTAAPDDFHYLTVLSRLTGDLPADATPALAQDILALDHKLRGRENRPQLRWKDRLAEVVQNLLRRDPPLANALLQNPLFVAPAHVPLVSILGSEHFTPAARLFLKAVQQNPRFRWSGPLVDVLAALPAAQVRPLFRQQWTNTVLRDDLVVKLAQQPAVVDRDKFLAGLSSSQPQVARTCLAALQQLPGSGTGRGVLPALMYLRRLFQEPDQQVLRAQTLSLIEKETKHTFRVRDVAGPPGMVEAAYRPVFDWCEQRNPRLRRLLDGDTRDDPAMWSLKLKAVPWHLGNPNRGRMIFSERSCQLCHSTGASLGPSLSGITARRSSTELFEAIVFPNRNVTEPYRNTTFRTTDKRTITGLVVSDTAESVLVQTTATSTVRLAPDNIISALKTTQSIMPSGLLRGLTSQGLADLYAYLKTL